MLKKKNRSRVWILISAIIAAIFALCALVTFMPSAPVSADAEKVEVTSVASGTVSLGELCERHDVLYALLPGGAAYASSTNDTTLQSLIQDGRVTVYDSKTMLNIDSDGVLHGWNPNASVSPSELEKALLVFPNTIKSVNYNVGNALNSPNHIFAGIAFESGGSLKKFGKYLFKKNPSDAKESDVENIRFVVLSQNITELEASAFSGWAQLQDVVMPGVTTIGSKAFGEATNLHHISISNKVTSIASDAFSNAVNLVDVEINSNSTDIAKLNMPYAMNVYGSTNQISSTNKTKSYLRVVENYGKNTGVYGNDASNEKIKNREVNNSFLFSYNNRISTDTVLATANGATANYAKKWYFIGLDGIEDNRYVVRNSKNGVLAETTEYHLPDQFDLTEARTKIKWDYLGADGTKYVNEFKIIAEGTTASNAAVDKIVTKYDINKGASYNRMFSRVFLPQSDAVENIGDWAFFSGQVQFADISASVKIIGRYSFKGNHRVKDNSTIYIRKSSDQTLYVGNYAFAVQADWGIFSVSTPSSQTELSRNIIFANKAAYDSEKNKAAKYNSAGDSTVNYTYLIPINTVVSDGETETKTFVRNGLYGKTYRYTVNDDMKWSDKAVNTLSLPTLDGFVKNIWYQENTYTNVVAESFSDINTKLASGADEINLYTKKVADPVFEDQSYTYDKEVSATTMLTFGKALKFTEQNEADYDAELASFADFNNNPDTPANVQNAGVYSIKVILDPKWGVWDGTHDHTYTVTVERAEIDLGDLNNVPEFVTDTGAPLGGTGEGVSLYEYPDGWYLYAKSDELKDPTVTVLNSYARFSGQQITISAAADASRKFRVQADANTSGKESGRILASFTFVISDPNYIFVNKSFESNRETFNKLGMAYTNITAASKNVTSVNVTKYWYIVTQQNWLVDNEYTGDVEQGGNYVMLTLDGEPVSTFEYESAFGDGDGEYKLHIPKIAKGEITGGITFTVTYGINNPEPITVDENGALVEKDINDLSDYINAAMPAGNYTVKIKAGEATESSGNKLPEINETVRLNVTRGTLDITDIQSLLTGAEKDGDGAYVGNTFEHVYNQGSVYLLDDASKTRLNGLATALDNKLNTVRKALVAARAGSAWGNGFYDKYYDSLEIKYNLDRMQTSEYYTAAGLAQLNLSRVPSEVGQYIIYYSLSALNYDTVGGASATDRRDYRFNTVIYREITTEAFAIGGTIKNKLYTGSAQYPDIPYSQYYTHGYIADADYINAGEKKVTFTINDPLLTRWTDENKPSNVTLELGENGKYTAVATVSYYIEKADNGWNAAPQMPSWSFNGFDADINTVASSLKFANENIVVTYYIVNGDGEYLSKDGVSFTNVGSDYFSFTVTAASDEGSDVPVGRIIDDENGSVERTLNALKPGTYYLASSVDGDGNINAFTTAENVRNRLTITKASNSWRITPNVIRWAWGGYNKSLNTISATPLYPDRVPYDGFDKTLYKNASGVTPEVTYSVSERTNGADVAIAGLESFVSVDDIITADGEQKTVADILSALPAGTYVLYTELGGTDYYSDIARSELEFNIAQAVNGWTTTPNVIRWTWGAYDINVNLIRAVAEYDSAYGTETAPTVKYSVLDSQYAKINDTLVNFETTDGVVSGDVSTALADLNAGTYYLVASLEGRRNYTAINPKAITADESGETVAYDFGNAQLNRTLNPVEFKIGIADNYWEIEPRMTSWQYNAFVAMTNFVAGTPHYPLAGKTVTYGVRKTPAPNPIVKPVAATEENDTGYIYVFTEMNAAAVEYFKSLEARDAAYYFVAYVDGVDDNYNQMSVVSTFFVNKVGSNSWKDGKEPTATGWTYGKYASTGGSVTAGEPTLGDAGKSSFTVEKQDPLNENSFASVTGYSGLTYSALLEKLNSPTDTLGAGTYRLIVTSESSENFVSATRELRFTVAKDGNAWKDGVEPAIDGWTYGSETNAPTTVEAMYENAAVSYTYYRAVLRDSVWVATGNPIAVDTDTGRLPTTTPAGDYVCVVTAAATNNYAVLTNNVYFQISKYENKWGKDENGKSLEPEAQPQWVWGTAQAYFADKAFTKAAAEKGDAPTYAIRKTSAGAAYNQTFDQSDIQAALAALGVGSYEITVTVAGSDDYTSISKICYIEVTPASFTWATGKKPSGSGWTWDDSQKPLFAEPSVNTVLETDVANIGYDVGVKGGATVHYTDYDEMANAVRGLGADVYEITVTAENDNYYDLSETVEITIEKATFTWLTDNAPKNASWSWNDKWTEADGGRNIVEPKANDKIGNPAAVKLAIGDTEYTYVELVAYLQSNDRDAGAYVVSVTVEKDNYVTISTTFTVTVTQAQNNWKDGKAPETNIVKEFGTDLDSVVIAEALFGTVEYGGSYTGDKDLLTWINGLSSDTYTFTTFVTGNDNYAGIAAVTTTVTVKGIGAAWDNEGSLKNEYVFTYGSDLADNMDTVVIPLKTPPEALKNKATLEYTITYKPFIGDSFSPVLRYEDYDTKEKAVKAWLTNAERGAGTYTIVADYKPNDEGGNYSPLNHTITITVNKAKLSWANIALETLYNRAFQNFGDVPTPTAGAEHTVKYTISGTVSEERNDITDLAKYLNGLSVGEYSIGYEIEETNNYTGLDALSFNVTIYKASNDWKDPSVLKKDWVVYRGGEFEFVVPEAQRGSVDVVVTRPGETVGSRPNGDINVWLKAQNYPADSRGYGVSFSVEGTDNYNGLLYECTLYIRKNANGWTEGKAPVTEYSWRGAAERFAVPEAQNHNELLRFDIAKVGGGDGYPKTVSVDGLQAELDKLVFGTYTVTSRVGSLEEHDADADIRAYNNDYEYLAGTTTIIMSRGGNSFTDATKLVNNRWSYGATVEITKPVAAQGNGAIVYSIDGNKVDGTAVSLTFDTAKDSEAFDKFLDAVNKLDAGSYSVTASIDASPQYEAATTSATYTVDKVVTAWTLTDAELENYKNLSCTWGSVNGTLLPVLELKNFDGVAVAFAVNGVTLVDDKATADVNEGSWLYNLKLRNAGTYRLTAFVEGDDNHTDLSFELTVTINPVTTSWSNQTLLDSNKSVTWIWKDANNAALVMPVLSGWEQSKVVYTLTGKNNSLIAVDGTNTSTADWSKVVATLNEQDSGTYVIAASVNDPEGNHTSLSYEITVIINKVTTAWSNSETELNAGKNLSWTWGSRGTDKQLPTLATANYAGATIKYTYSTISGGAGTSLTEEWNGWLDNQPAGTYYFTATVDADGNHTALSYEATVTIGMVPTAWSNSETELNAGKNLSWTWGERGENKKLPTLALKNFAGATIKYTYATTAGGATTSLTEEWNGWLDNQPAGTYYFTATVDADSNHTALSYEATVTIGMVTTAWSNSETELNAAKNLSWTHGDKDHAKLPVLAVANWADGKIVYTVAQTGKPLVTLPDDKDWNTYIDEQGAGTYVLTAAVTGDANHTGLTYSATVAISGFTTEWNNLAELNANKTLSWDYGATAKTLPTPVANWGTVKYYITVGNSKTQITGEGADWNSALVGKDAGTYIMSAEITGDGDHSDLSFEITVTINTVTTVWTNADSLATGIVRWTFGSPDLSKLVKPEVNRGNVKYTYGGASSGEITDWNDLKTLAAGEYTITATVTKLDVNQTDLAPYTVTLVVEKINVTLNGKPDYTELTWNFDSTNNPALPELTANNWKEDGKIVYTVKLESGATQTLSEDWNDWLKKQHAGTYVFTASVNVTEADGNYTDDEYTLTVTVLPYATAWTNDGDLRKTPISWTYGTNDYTKVPIPVPSWGAEKTAYSYSDGTSTYVLAAAEGKTIADAWNDALKGLGFGSYTFSAHVDGDGDHGSLDYSVIVTVARATNTWKHSIVTDSDKTTDKDKLTWVYGAKNVTVNYQAENNDEALEIRVNGTRVGAGESDLSAWFDAYLGERGYGTYNIVASVPQNDYYGALTETVTLTVTRASNSWITPLAIGSDGVTAADGTVAEHGWTWDDRKVKENIFTAPVSAIGSEAIITVFRITVSDGGSTSETVISATIGFREDGGKRVANANDVTAFLNRLFALDAGDYKITASIAANDNYESLGGAEAAFTVKQAKNEWIKEPTVGTLSFGSNAPNPESQARYGAVEKYEFAHATDGAGNEIAYENVTAWLESAPIAAGAYYVRGKISGTANYTELQGHSKYSIGTGANTWVNMPGVVAWSWNNYDKTVNLFSGSARSNGKATFGIRKGTLEKQEVLTVSDFENFNGKPISTAQRELLTSFELQVIDLGDDNKVKYVSDEIAEVLNALKPGTYVLVVNVEGGESLTDLDGKATFEVRSADNEWKTENGKTLAPNVLSFTHDEFVETGDRKSFTRGQTKYGTNNVLYRVIGEDNDGNPYSSGVAGKTASEIETILKSLAAGSYSLQAWVPSGVTYNAFYTEDAPYSVLFGVSRAQNGWATGKAPAERIDVQYTDLQKLESIESKFAEPQAVSGKTVVYEILDNGQRVIKSGVAYAQLLGELKALGYGNYFIRSTVAQSCNYTSVTQNTAVAIGRQPNAYIGFDKNSVNVQWRMTDNKVNNDVSEFTEITADHGSVVYTLRGDDYTYSELAEYLKTVNVGTYNVTISVDGTDDYEGCAETVIAVNVVPADNAWTGGWTVGSSLKLNGAAVSSWKWSSTVVWTGVKPLYGNTVYVMIARADNAEDALRYFTIDAASNFEAQSALVGEAVSALGYGKYVLTVTAPASGNWNALDDAALTKLEFEVTQTDNEWSVAPAFTDTNGDAFANNTWAYNTAVVIRADALHGDFTVEYFAYDNNEKGKAYAQLPTDAGKYLAVFAVKGTDEYKGLETEIPFAIDKILYEAYSVVPGIVPWTWNEYSRLNNLFTGSAMSGGKVSYAILQNGVVAEVDGVKLENIELDNGGYVSQTIAEKISKLLSGNYELRVSFAETNNYRAFYSTVSFVISAARNEWTITPRVSPWSVNNWVESESTPIARSAFGDPTVTIIGKADDVVYYKAVYKSVKGEYETEISILNRAPAGWYTMRATVEAEQGKYENKLDDSVDFQIFIQGSPDSKNNWAVSPEIKPWMANVNGVYGEIVGKPIRGLPYFEFYTAVRVDGVLTLGDKVEAGEDTVTVKAGSQYYKDFYVPMAPGQYYMVARAEYEANGSIVATDSLTDSPRLFEIGNRDNTFEQDVRIDTVLYLGEKAAWSDKYPTAKAALEGSEITYEFSNAETGEKLGSNIPTTPGKYKVTATAVAKYSAPIRSEIEFTVALSQNSWVNDESPTIGGWSEEFSDSAPDPVGAARFGTIVYTYVNVLEPDVILTEKPLTAGTYIMYAKVELDGYVTLESSYRFTIDEAFDRTFVTIDIILGLVACAFAVVVIVFAVRRYKENG